MSRGFTLIELIVVIAILSVFSIMTSVITPKATTITNTSATTNTKTLTRLVTIDHINYSSYKMIAGDHQYHARPTVQVSENGQTVSFNRVKKGSLVELLVSADGLRVDKIMIR